MKKRVKEEMSEEKKLFSKYGIDMFTKLVEKQPNLSPIYEKFCNNRKSRMIYRRTLLITLGAWIGIILGGWFLRFNGFEVGSSWLFILVPLALFYLMLVEFCTFREEFYIHQLATGVKREVLEEILKEEFKNDAD